MYVLNYRVYETGVAIRIGLRCVPYTLKNLDSYKTCFMLNIPEDRSHDDDQVAFQIGQFILALWMNAYKYLLGSARLQQLSIIMPARLAHRIRFPWTVCSYNVQSKGLYMLEMCMGLL